MTTDIGNDKSVCTIASAATEVGDFCRICATTGSGNLFSIFSQEGELWDVAEKIGRCLPIIVLPSDTLPLNICIQCLMKLNTSYELVITALNSEAKLKAKLHLAEDPTFEALYTMGTDRTQVKEEIEAHNIKMEMSPDMEELAVIPACEVVLSLEMGNNERREETSSEITVAACNSQEQNTTTNETNRDVPIETLQNSNVKVNKSGSGEIAESRDIENLLPLELPSLTIYGPATCDICNTTFVDMDEFDNHVMSQHLRKHKWQCVRCDDSFEQSQDLVCHKAEVHNEEAVSCGQCWVKKENEEISDESLEEEWLEETESHSDESRIHTNNIKENGHVLEFYCELCDKNFGDEAKLKDHYLIHASPLIVCNKCGLKCSSLYELSVHKKSHTKSAKDKKYTCEVCRKTFLERILLTYHRRHCGSKQYTCTLCERTFWREYSYHLHMKAHNYELKNYECDCGKKFDSHSAFQAHRKTHERPTAVMKCVTCNKTFTNEIFYKRHRYIHDPEFWDRFKCQICQRPFRDAHALKNHMQLHAGVKPHMCDLCGRTYNRYANMVKHRKLHKPQNLWEHNCTQCEAKFERLKDLMSHIENAHNNGDTTEDDKSGKKPLKWICRFCGKRISTKLSLQDHERIHTGAKPYICEWCGREFRSRPNLLQHHLTHTGDRKHACEVCGKKFARKSFIAQHMRVHTGEKPFQCDVCHKCFTQAGDMRRHRNRHVQQKEQYALLVQIQQ